MIAVNASQIARHHVAEAQRYVAIRRNDRRRIGRAVHVLVRAAKVHVSRARDIDLTTQKITGDHQERRRSPVSSASTRAYVATTTRRSKSFSHSRTRRSNER